MSRGCAQSGVTYGSPTFLVSPDVGTVFDEATLVIDTLNTSELATGSTVGTKADVICAPPPLEALLWQLMCYCLVQFWKRAAVWLRCYAV